MPYKANRKVESTTKTFSIVERLAADGQLGVSELAIELNMSKGIVHNHLSTLRELGYVAKTGKKYMLSPEFLALGIETRSNTNFYQYSETLCREFANRFNIGVVLFQRTNKECIIIETYRLSGTPDIDVGTAFALNESAAGLTMLTADGQELSRVPKEYQEAKLVESVEEHGYAVTSLTTNRSQVCISVPIVNSTDECHAAVVVLLPEDEPEHRIERITERAVTLGEKVEKRFESDWTGERSFATEKHSWIGG